MDLTLLGDGELLALHNVFFEAKYCNSPADYDVQGSPYVRTLYEYVFSEIVKRELAKGRLESVEAWQNWRKLENHPHRMESLKRRIISIHKSNWVSLSEPEKHSYITCLICPLIAGEENISELLEYANAFHARS